MLLNSNVCYKISCSKKRNNYCLAKPRVIKKKYIITLQAYEVYREIINIFFNVFNKRYYEQDGLQNHVYYYCNYIE